MTKKEVFFNKGFLLFCIFCILLIIALALSCDAQASETPPTPTPQPVFEPYLLIWNYEAPLNSVLEVPIRLYGDDINAVVFEIEYSENLELLNVIHTLESPYASGCEHIGNVLQCVVYGFGKDGDNIISIPDESKLFQMTYKINGQGSMVIYNYSFGDIHGQSVPGSAQGGTVFLRGEVPPTDSPPYPGPTAIEITDFSAKSGGNILVNDIIWGLLLAIVFVVLIFVRKPS